MAFIRHFSEVAHHARSHGGEYVMDVDFDEVKKSMEADPRYMWMDIPAGTNLREVDGLVKTRVKDGLRQVRISVKRMHNFVINGTVCASCGISASRLTVVQRKTGSLHIDFYAPAPDGGDDVMMTIDHIVPKSLGGADSVRNYQTMCMCCNTEKAATPET